MRKPVILTGLRANAGLHIGHYFGALLPLIDMANKKSGEYQINLFVPDLHSFTTPIDHSKLQEQIMNNLKLFVAAGLPLNNNNVHIYRQSYVSAHSELMWILSCFTGFGEMSRMTQFKEKRGELSAHTDNLSTSDNHQTDYEPVTAGLFNYPILMAADILLYRAEYVPVGDDQTQHLEFTRDLAARFNKKFGEIFTVPQSVKKQHEFFGKDQGLRVRNLVDPTKKMSKSEQSGKGIIFLNDEPSLASKKIMSAITDSKESIHYDYQTQPGISNLIDLLSLFSNEAKDEIIERYSGQTKYGPLKTDLAERAEQFLVNFQSNLKSADETQITEVLRTGEAKANQQAGQTLDKVRKAIGLR